MATRDIFEAAFTIAEAKKILGISRPTVMKIIRAKALPAFKVGKQWRIKPNDLRQYIDGNFGTE